MCKPASFIVTQDKVFWSKVTDSHEEIIKEFDLCPDDVRNAKIVRVELSPADNNLNTAPSNWKFVTDQPDVPEWYNADEAEAECRRLIHEWKQSKVFTEGVHEVHSGTAYASGSATVKAYESATVYASGSATVEAHGSATVNATGSATVYAYESATVEAHGSATVYATGSATVYAYDSATVKASGSATVKAYESATVKASGSATVYAYDSATVNATGSVTVISYKEKGITLCSPNAACIYRTGGLHRALFGTGNTSNQSRKQQRSANGRFIKVV